MNAAVFLLASLAIGAANVENAANSPPPETQDLVFFSDARPVFLRVRVLVDGKGFETRWVDAIRRLHKTMDRDGDGRLSAKEREAGAWLKPQSARPMTGRIHRQPQAVPVPSDAKAGATDKVVTAEDLINYLRPNTGPIQLELSGSDSSPELLFAKLDTDGDKKLSRAELEAAETSLRKIDRDDDETIRLEEIQAYRNPYYGQAMAQGAQANPEKAPFALLGPTESRAKLVRRLIARYDRGAKDDALARAEIGLEPEAFANADGDGDGRLDADELIDCLWRLSPDLELVVKLTRFGQATVEVVKSGPKQTGLAAQTRKTRDGGLELVLNAVELELNSPSRAGLPDAKQFYMFQFKQADADNNKYLDKQESQRNGVFDNETFNLMDRDRDGKLFEDEMNDYIAQEADVSESRTMLTATDFGRSLFDALDTDRNRRLSQREIHEVVPKIATWDRNGDGVVGADEVPHCYRLGFGRGQSTLLSRFGFQVFAADMAGGMANVGNSPSWFSKMDRNHDGDLSRREFLGTLADFHRLDTDHDGLLDPAEAAKAK
jgi:Ca2+-binding EF-hand superfamily protein